MTGFLGAVQFLTRIPLRLRTAAPHERVVPWFGVVGCLIGAAVGGAAAGLWHVVPPLVAGACAVGIGLLITGAFHEDGLADVADAFGAMPDGRSADVERRMEILKDSRHGTYGVAALATSVVVRVAASGSFTSPLVLFGALVAAHGLARVGAMGAMLTVRPAVDAGLGADHARRLRVLPTSVGMVVAVAVSALVLGGWVLVAVGAVVVATAIVALLALRKIGGIAGDVLGAIEQVNECVLLVLISGLAAHGHLAA